MNTPSQAQILRIKVRNPETYLRILGLILFSVVFTIIMPYAGDSMSGFLFDHSINIGIIYAIIVGFIMSMALERSRELIDCVAVEINKLRHIHHLCEYISESQPALAPWYEDVSGQLRDYLSSFADKSFTDYAQSNGLFRGLIRSIYRLPQQHVEYPPEMYKNLIDTISRVAEARQEIREKVNFRIGAFQWSTIIIVSLTFCGFLLLGTPLDTLHRLFTGIFVFNVLIVLDLVYEYDGFKPAEMRVLTNFYAKDLKDLGLGASKGKRKARKAA